MIVVSDTSPLHYLIVIGQVGILSQLYGRVLCPPEVIEECQHAHAPDAVKVWAADLPEWLEISSTEPWEHPQLSRLDAGEAAAIRLARARGADVLLMDERKGRQVAARLGLPVAGVIAVLADAAIAGLLDFEKAVLELTLKTNFRISPQVLAVIRRRL
ncbi:putative nucleic acid-binding protein [Prosthecobacter fusiformis]|uniref:Putative nucleic acid-binding protein n=1 Tax=Prosthecobacter fusiformis TaxID=48464 RepID=A0A4R7RZQ2_9BACT|nr:DUF3368 domain-containing protein [Prosthecobacter fusiformis]TDU71351.1 putative nucleic acid-binding protein [Prosthecobacter fusiformis]